MPQFRYYTIQAGADTFTSEKVAGVIERYIDDVDTVLNPCAGETPIPAGNEIRNDIDPTKPADYHIDAREIGAKIQQQVDVVAYDPPFSEHQAIHTYDLEPEQWPGYQPVHREVHPLLCDSGYLIQAGFSAVPLDPSIRSEYTRRAIVVCNQLGRQDDWMLTVDEKTPEESATSRPWTDSASIVPNSNRHDNGTFAIDYTAVSGPVTAAHLWDTTQSRVSGKTLLLDWQGDLSASRFGVEAPVERFTSTDQLVKHVSLQNDGTPTPPSELDSILSEYSPDTVVVWPYERASSHNTAFQGAEIGFIRAIKQQLDRYIGTGTEVLLIGNTATGMRATWDYEHTGVSIVDGENHDSAWYISEFWKTQRGLGERKTEKTLTPIGEIESMLDSPADNFHASDGDGNWIVRSPRVRLERHPVLYYHCPECGAAGGNCCVEDGTPLPSSGDKACVHQARHKYTLNRLQQCESIPVYDGGQYLGDVSQTVDQSVLATASKATLSGTNVENETDDKGNQQSLDKFVA